MIATTTIAATVEVATKYLEAWHCFHRTTNSGRESSRSQAHQTPYYAAVAADWTAGSIRVTEAHVDCLGASSSIQYRKVGGFPHCYCFMITMRAAAIVAWRTYCCGEAGGWD